jgi:hypothetical protein
MEDCFIADHSRRITRSAATSKKRAACYLGYKATALMEAQRIHDTALTTASTQLVAAATPHAPFHEDVPVARRTLAPQTTMVPDGPVIV